MAKRGSGPADWSIAYDLYEQHGSYAKVAKLMHVSAATVTKWIKTERIARESIPDIDADELRKLAGIREPEQQDLLQPNDSFREFATDVQWEYVLAVRQYGNPHAAAKAIGRDPTTVAHAIKQVLKKAGQKGWAPHRDIFHKVSDGMSLKGTSVKYAADGSIDQYWNKTKQEGRDPDEVVKLADPKKITKLSTLYDQEGNVSQQWVSEKPELIAREKLWKEFGSALADQVTRADVIPVPQTSRDDLMACYPVGDHHLGQLSWHRETGANYDLEISEKLLRSAFDYLIKGSPDCDQALVPFLGDFMHYDSFESVTPTSRNQLDADGRFPKMVRVAVRTMRYAIEAAAAKHKNVRVIVEIGNHDLSSSIFLMECLNNVYENNPRITVDCSPKHFHYFEFGKCLVGTHHGHGPKLDKLPMIMATDMPEAWGRTRHRYWWTGHIHHDSTRDFEGCKVESHRVLAAPDAWASQKGYRSSRDMKAIVLHRDFGEVSRLVASPSMFGNDEQDK